MPAVWWCRGGPDNRRACLVEEDAVSESHLVDRLVDCVVRLLFLPYVGQKQRWQNTQGATRSKVCAYVRAEHRRWRRRAFKTCPQERQAAGRPLGAAARHAGAAAAHIEVLADVLRVREAQDGVDAVPVSNVLVDEEGLQGCRQLQQSIFLTKASSRSRPLTGWRFKRRQ